MPTRTYTGIDLINYVAAVNLGSEIGGVSTYNEASQVNGVLSGNWTGVLDSSAATALTTARVEITGELDFDAFPAIPANALISRVTYKIAGTTIINNTGTPSGGQSSTSAGTGILAVFRGASSAGELLTDILMLETAVHSPPAGNPSNVALNGAITFSDEHVFDFSGSPIDRATFVSMFQQIAIYLGQVPAADVPGSNNVTGSSAFLFASGATASLDYTTSVTALQIQVEYSEGPLNITLNPAGGNVESGQSIIASGDNVQNIPFAALQGDNVIPLLAKPNPDGTVTLTVPNPASPLCQDALADCPECEDCFDACSESLEGEECQACMQACLDCLTAFFENLELAEDCQDSTQDPPDDVPITIICNFPDLGTVPLGTFTILLTNGSGVYQFITGKTNDTLYSSSRDGSTYDVKIPNPFLKTGFFRS